MKLRADLHVHSCLSPCGSLRLSPTETARRAREVGLDALALTDHNTARQVPAVSECCRKAGVLFIPGIEATTVEEIHVLCLFEHEEAAIAFGDYLYGRLPDVRCDPEKMGDQVFTDASGRILGSLDRYLGTATDCTLTDLVERVTAAGGLAIPAHVDRPSYGMLGRLGYVPPLFLPTVEVSPRYDRQADPLGLAAHHRLITGSDAHEPEDIGSIFAEIEVAERTVHGLLQVLRTPR